MGTAAIILGILGVIASIAGTAITNTQNKRLTKETQLDNYLYTDKLQENAQLRKEDFYNKYENPLAIRTQLEQAGLNTALMYQNGTGTIGASQAASAPGINQSAPIQYKYEIDPLTAAQIRNIEADTNLKNEEAGNKAQSTLNLKTENEKLITQIANIAQQTENYKAQRQLLGLQSEYQQIQNNFAQKMNIKQLELLGKQIEYTSQETKRVLLSNEITEKTKEDIILNARKQNQLITSQIMLNQANKELTNEQKTKAHNEIIQAYQRITLEAINTQNEKERTKIMQQRADQELQKINNDYQLGLDKNTIDMASQNIWSTGWIWLGMDAATSDEHGEPKLNEILSQINRKEK